MYTIKAKIGLFGFMDNIFYVTVRVLLALLLLAPMRIGGSSIDSQNGPEAVSQPQYRFRYVIRDNKMEPESKSLDSMKNLYANGFAARGFKAAVATVDHAADVNGNRFPAQLPVAATTLNAVDSFAKLAEPTQNNQIEQAASVQTPNVPSSLYGIYRTGLTPFKKQPTVATNQAVVDSKPVVPSIYYTDNIANATSASGETVNDTNSDDAYLNRTSPKSIQVELNYKDESVLLEELTKRINDEPATVIPSSDAATSTSDTTDNPSYRTSADPPNQDNFAAPSVNQSSSATITTTAQPSSLLDMLNKNRYNWKELLNQHLTLNGAKKIIATTSSPPTSTRSETDASKFAEFNRYAFPGNFLPPFSTGIIPTKYPSAVGAAANSAFTAAPMNFPIFYPTLQVPNTFANVSGPYNRLLMGADASAQQEPITENPFFTRPALPVFIPSAILPYYALLPPFPPAFINDNSRCNDKQGPKRGIDFSQSLRSPLPPPPPYKPELAFVLMSLPQSSLNKRKV